MLILSFESSARAASVALCDNGRLIARYFQDSGLTHSQTLLPTAENLLKNTCISFSDIDHFAVSHGPGSFTGVRIGISTVKGLCWASEKKAVGVSTLEAMAWQGAELGEGAVLCCAMDARRNQVYNALFRIVSGIPLRLCPDRALSLTELGGELESISNPIFFIGDGSELCYNQLGNETLGRRLAPLCMRMQSAWGVCLAAADKEPIAGEMLLPVYLRLSQAERNRQGIK